MAESAIDDKDVELRAAKEALNSAKEEATVDLREAEKERKELISKHDETVRRYEETITALEEHLEEYKGLLEKKEVQFELARLQSLEALREKFDKERETYLSRMDDLEKEVKKLVRCSTSPVGPETRKRDDAATSGEDELRGLGVRSREKESEKDSGAEKVTFQRARAVNVLVWLSSRLGKRQSLWWLHPQVVVILQLIRVVLV